MSRQVPVSIYIVFTASHDFAGRLTAITFNRVTRERPPKLGTTDVAIHARFMFDSAIFEQYLPEVTINVDSTRAVMVPEVSLSELSDEVDPTKLLENTPEGDPYNNGGFGPEESDA